MRPSFAILFPDSSVFKIYVGYDRTAYSNYTDNNRYLFCLGENNVYLNSTFRTAISGGWEWFSGMAYSLFDRKVDGAVTEGDHWCEKQTELHFKTKLSKKFHPTFRMDVGFESFLRRYETRYSQVSVADNKKISPTIEAGFVAASYYPVENLKAELSFRIRIHLIEQKMNFSPRLSLCYHGAILYFRLRQGDIHSYRTPNT